MSSARVWGLNTITSSKEAAESCVLSGDQARSVTEPIFHSARPEVCTLFVTYKVAITSGRGVPSSTRSKGVGVRVGVGVSVIVGVAVGVKVGVGVGDGLGVDVGSSVGVGVALGVGSEQAARFVMIRTAGIRMRGSLNFITGISSINCRYANCSIT